MKVKKVATLGILFVLIVFLTGCDEKNYLNNLNNMQNSQQSYIVFPADYDVSFEIGGNERYIPTDQDIQNAIEILAKFLIGNKEIRELQEYKIQFFGYKNENKEKIIWANYFCNEWSYTGVDWKTDLVSVDDGGNCYFNLKVNLDTKEIFDFMVNGWA
jgi:hypothetical protein